MEQKDFILQDNSPITMPTFQAIFDKLMSRTWEYNGNFYNLKELGWSWGYSSKKRSLGTASYNRHSAGGRITISKTLLSLNLTKNPRKFEDTIRHEIAHAIDYIIRGDSAHDRAWQLIAIHLGAIPSSSTKKIVSAPSKWIGICPNNHPHKRHVLTKKGKGSACARCCNEHNGGEYSDDFLIKWDKQF